MTLDLKEHMQKKRHINAYDVIGKAVDGMQIGEILHILSSFTLVVLSHMDPMERMKAAETFYEIIVSELGKTEEPIQ